MPCVEDGLMRFDRASLEHEGFTGWLSFADARESSLCPTSGGVYVVSYEGPHPATFPDASPAGRFKGKDPTVDVALLTSNWVAGADVVYIGRPTSFAGGSDNSPTSALASPSATGADV